MSLMFCRKSRCIHDYMQTKKVEILLLLLKIYFIPSRQPITAKFAKLREIATAIIRVHNFDNPDLFTLCLDRICSQAMKKAKIYHRLKSVELRENATALICLRSFGKTRQP